MGPKFIWLFSMKFLVADTQLYLKEALSVRGFVGLLVRRSVGPSVCWSVGPLVRGSGMTKFRSGKTSVLTHVQHLGGKCIATVFIVNTAPVT